MNGRIELKIDALSITGLPDDADAQAVRQAVESAFRKLAARLARSPLERPGVRELTLERLSLDTISADELLSERGAERLADELYTAIGRTLR